ncbi:MAG: MFS transporter, partial [Pseudomonadota bacterium]|nr:MFS transporter [Pseudomonadota bacterium]
MRAADRAVYGRLSFFYASYFLLAGLMLPYWPVWLNARGLSVTDVGLVLSVSYWLKTVVQPLIARRADQAGENRRIMVILAALAVLAMASLTVGESLWLVALMALVVASF